MTHTGFRFPACGAKEALGGSESGQFVIDPCSTRFNADSSEQRVDKPSRELMVPAASIKQCRRSSDDSYLGDLVTCHNRTTNRIAAEVKLLRQCSHWLKQLENGEEVLVDLRPESDPTTEYVRFDRLQVVRILERIAADLDQLADGASTQADGNPQSERRRRLAQEPKPKRRLSTG